MFYFAYYFILIYSILISDYAYVKAIVILAALYILIVGIYQ